jgi:hypothetical protein
MTTDAHVPACSEAGSKIAAREVLFRTPTPDEERNPENARSIVNTIMVDGQTFNRFQKVAETVQNPLADDETTIWTICGFPVAEGTNEMTVLMKDPPAWSRSKRVRVSQLVPQQYEPLTAEDGSPLLGY